MFWQKEPAYIYNMGSLTAKSDCIWLSCDHTCASVSNIGCVRLDDGKWVKQYIGLFCMLNPEGQVLTWKLTRSLCFEHIEEQLKLRFHQKGQVVQEFFVDICCSLRQKLQNIFGSHLKEHLDIFHILEEKCQNVTHFIQRV